MTTTTEWLEQYTGMKFDGTLAQPDPEERARQFEAEAARKQMLLAHSRKALLNVKADFQEAMSSEIKIKGKFFKQRMLEVNGTQVDEVEFEELDFSVVELDKSTMDVINRGSNTIMMHGESLAEAMTVRDGKSVKLFTAKELEDEYWFPLTRERILPETYTGDIYSKTQKMLDESNALYTEAVEDKREKGQLTPKANRVRDLISSSADLVSIGADVAGAFGPGSEQAARAKTILGMISQVISGGGEVYDKVKAKEYGDASGKVLDNMSLITQLVLTQAGVDPEIVKATKAGFKAGSAAIEAGQKFAKGVEGAGEGVEVLAEVLAGVLEIAAGQVKDENQKSSLEKSAVLAPMAMKELAIGFGLGQCIAKGDSHGAIDCLTRAAKTAIEGEQGMKKLEKTEGLEGDEKAKVEKQIDLETSSMTGIADLSGLGADMVVQAAILLYQGKYLKAFEETIDRIGDGLQQALQLADVSEDDAKKVGVLYKSSVSGAKVLVALSKPKPDVEGALKQLSAGIGGALGAVAPDSPELQKAGDALAAAFVSLRARIKTEALFDQNAYAEGIEQFIAVVKSGARNLFNDADLSGGKKDGEDDDENPLPSGLKELLADLGRKAKAAGKEINANAGKALEKEVEKAAQDEALAILEEARADITREPTADLTEAEKLAREASDIDKLIAKMQRDQMVMKIAQQILEGGTAFLASFVPALGAVNAGLRMMASMVAAAQRAQQLYLWAENKKDFATAQSALTSASQNFVKNQRDQFTHHSIQATFAAAEMIGNVLHTVGPGSMGAGSAAGTGLMVAGKAGAKLEKVIQRHKKAEELEYAWRITKRAFENPSNRKLGLQARALNPTLAKYAIAWGAVNAKDPLARNALKACDLTEAVLENENANVHKVVSYLETFYYEDDKLYREIEADAKWVPDDVELTLLFWSRLKTAAVTNVKLKNPDTGTIDGLLTQLRVPAAKLAGIPALETRIATLLQLDRVLRAYVPDIADAKGLKAFKNVLAILLKQEVNARKQAEARKAKLEAEAKAALEGKSQADEAIAKAKQTALEQRLSDEAGFVNELEIVTSRADAFDEDDDDLDQMKAVREEADALLAQLQKGKPELRDAAKVKAGVDALTAALNELDKLMKDAASTETV